MATANWEALMNQASEGPEPVPDGNYDVVVESAKAEEASTGRHMVVVVFNIVNGPYAGKKVWNNFVLVEDNPNSLGYFFQHMAVLGADQAFFAQIPGPPDGLAYVAQRIQGQYATITVGHRMWNGKNRNQVNEVKPFAGAPTMPTPAAPVAPAAPPVQPPPVGIDPGAGIPPAAPQPQPQPQQPVPPMGTGGTSEPPPLPPSAPF